MNNIISRASEIKAIEKDVFPLIEFKYMYVQCCSEDYISDKLKSLNALIDQGFVQVLDLHNKFKQFDFLFDRSSSQLIKKLFPTKLISAIDLELFSERMNEQQQALLTIQSICADDENLLMFQVKTKLAKDQLMNKISELNGLILGQAVIIFNENIQRIQKEYSEMCVKMKKIPKDEMELIDIKTFI